MSFWDFFLLMIWTYVFIAYLFLLFHIIGDIFRDKDLGGVAKAAWIIGLIVFPFLLALVYLIVRGRGMAERQASKVSQARADTDQYIKSVASTSSPADQITFGLSPPRLSGHIPLAITVSPAAVASLTPREPFTRSSRRSGIVLGRIVRW